MKEQLSRKIIDHVEKTRQLEKDVRDYLVALQSGELGTPSIDDLKNAGLLHSWLGHQKLCRGFLVAWLD